MDDVKHDDTLTEKGKRPSLLEQKLAADGNFFEAGVLSQMRTQPKAPDKGREKTGIVTKGTSLKDRIDAALLSWETKTGRDVLLTALEKNPLELLKIRAALEPKNLNVEHAVKQVVFVVYEGKPPDDWTPPLLAGENAVDLATSKPVLDEIAREAEDGDET